MSFAQTCVVLGNVLCSVVARFGRVGNSVGRVGLGGVVGHVGRGTVGVFFRDRLERAALDERADLDHGLLRRLSEFLGTCER